MGNFVKYESLSVKAMWKQLEIQCDIKSKWSYGFKRVG